MKATNIRRKFYGRDRGENMSDPASPAETRLDAALADVDMRLDAISSPPDPAATAPPKPSLRVRFADAGNKIKVRAVEDGEKIKERAAQAGEKIKDTAEYVATPDFTEQTILDEGNLAEKEIFDELEIAKEKIARNRERTNEVLAEMDADALLMKKIFEQRSGLRGIINRIDEKFSIKGLRLSGIVTTGAFAMIADKILLAHKVANPVAGGIVGGVAGGIWGYIRGKNKQESVNRWLTDVNIAKMTPSDFNDMQPAQLDIALGVINNAVHEGRVRGGTKELRQMMQTYRYMKEVRAKKGKVETERDPAKDVLEKIDLETKTEAEIGKSLAAQASEKYKGLYDEIINGKKKQIWGSAIKGAVVGASLGTVLSWAVSKFSAAHGGTGGQESNLNHTEQVARDLHAQHAGAAANPGSPLPDGMTEVQRIDIMQHASNLLKTPGAHVDGFTQSGIEQFGQHLQNNPSYWNLVHEAGLNNIDLTAATSNGQTLGNFLMANKDAFLHLAPELQRQMLSFPALAPEIMASAATGAASIGISSAVLGGVALGAIGFGIAGEVTDQAGKKEKFEAIDKAIETGKTKQKTLDKKLATAGEGLKDKEKKDQTFEDEQREAEIKSNTEESMRRLINSEVTLLGLDSSLVGSFIIVGIDAEGELDFKASPEQAAKMRLGEFSFPRVKVGDILNENGNLDKEKIIIIHTAKVTEKKPTGKSEFQELNEVKSAGKYVEVELTRLKMVRRDGEDIVSAIRLPSGTEVAVEDGSADKIAEAGKKFGDKVEVKILNVLPFHKVPGKVYRVTAELKPETGKPDEAKKDPLAKLKEDFDEQPDVINADSIDTLDELVNDFRDATAAIATGDSSRIAIKVVVSDPKGEKYYQLYKVDGEKYTAKPYNPATGAISPSVELSGRDLSSEWKLYLEK